MAENYVRFLSTLQTLAFFAVDELIQLVAQRAGISQAKASLAVMAVLAYLTARLPSPVIGRIREHLGEGQTSSQKDVGSGSSK